jgi:hypothetical protein
VKNVAFPCLVLLCCLSFIPAAFAQASKTASKKDAAPAAAATPPPPSPELMKARMRPPVRGTAYIEIIKGTSKKVGDEIVTVTKVKNVSEAPIVGLKLEEFWYDKSGEAGMGDARLRYPLAPGETAELTTKSQFKTGLTSSNLRFSHQNGSVKPTSVKKFTEDKKK